MRYTLLALILALLVACAPINEQPENVTSDMPVDDVERAPSQPDEPKETASDAKFTVEYTEGDLIVLRPKAIDPDSDKITYAFTEPFNEDGEWQTAIGDAGSYFVAVTARDGKGARATETVRVIVSRANRPPSIECSTIIVNEGQQVNLHDLCTVSDEDNEEVIVTYSGWMTSWRYDTTYDDAGIHTVTITASDRRKNEVLHTVKKDVMVTVKNVNRAPVFSDDFPVLIRAKENDVVTLPKLLVDDPDTDAIRVTFSEPFDKNGVWKTGLGDAGSYDVDVVASDGESTTKRTVRVEISLLNTAPLLKEIPDIVVDEGQLIKLPISATDREGDKLSITVSGWMNSEEYQTSYDDAGVYTVKVTVSDGTFVTDDVVQVTVNDVNRPPVFVTPG